MKYLDYLIRGIEKLCAALIVAMTVVTFAQVINRYVFSGSFFWAEESAILFMIWIAFLGSIIAARKGAHTRIDFFVSLLPAGAKRVVEGLNHMICAVFLAVMAYNAMPIIRTTSRTLTPGMKIPRSMVYWALLIGCAAMVLYFIVLAVMCWMGRDPYSGQTYAGGGDVA